MNITVERRLRGADRMVARLEQIAAPAGKLVADKLGGRVPHVEFVITDAAGVTRGTSKAMDEIAKPLRGLTRIDNTAFRYWLARGRSAYTTPNRSGVAVLVNGPAVRCVGDWFDQVIVHELAHAVQFNLPGARKQHIEYLGTFAAAKPDMAMRREYERVIDIRERQAENLQVLARHLPKGN